MTRKFLKKEFYAPEKEEEFRTLFENVPAIIALIDKSYRIIKANRCFENIFGNQMGEFCFQAFKGWKEKCSPCPVENTFLQGTLQVYEELGRTKEGQDIYYLVYSAPIHNRKGEIQYALEMAIDLTERRILEKKLQANWFFLQNIIDFSPCAILAINEGGEVIFFNRLAREILGYLPSEIKHIYELETLFPKKIFAVIKNLLESRNLHDFSFPIAQETWLRSKMGEKVPVRLYLRAFFQEPPLPAEKVTLVFFEDLRSFKALEQQKIQAEKMAIVGQTIAGFAHGIKNIVTGLEGGAYVVQSALKKKDESLLEKGWEMVERNVEKISHLTKDLLNYSRARIPDVKLNNPQELLREVYNLFSPKAEKGGVQIIIESSPEMKKAYFDPQGIHTCLTNLISNALDACQQDPEPKNHRVILRSSWTAEGSLVLEVEDNGVGIPVEDQRKLFRSFFSTKGTAGTGLGLLITQKIVQEHGGTITVESHPGQGSIFRLILPQEGKES